MNNEFPSFEYLCKLAVECPEKLEELRTNHIEQLIQQAPVSMHRRLRGLQFQIDCTRQRHRSALGSCIEVSNMMRDSVNRLKDALNEPVKQNQKDSETSADILSFPAIAS